MHMQDELRNGLKLATYTNYLQYREFLALPDFTLETKNTDGSLLFSDILSFCKMFY